MAHGHSHDHPAAPASRRLRRRLALAVAPFVLATAIGVVLLWPSADRPTAAAAGDLPARLFDAQVVQVEPTPCQGVPSEAFRCARVEIELEQRARDATAAFVMAEGEGTRQLSAGDEIVVGYSPESQEQQYYFVDYQRRIPLALLTLLFAGVVLALSRWRGLAALVGLAISLAVLVWFMLPAILQGRSPLLVAIVGAAVIMFVTLYLAHGVNARTTTAVLGTMASLALTAILALLFVRVSNFTGLGSEEASFLQFSASQVNLEGLLLGGIIIGALGVLDDVTVTQAAAVWELHLANPRYGLRSLYGAAVRIGRDHIASTVNTLVLAYAGASLPLLILFSLADRPLGVLVNSEIVAEEIVRTLVGSVGLVAAVPITTALAAFVVAGDRERERSEDEPREGRDEKEGLLDDETDWKRPKAEMDWRA